MVQKPVILVHNVQDTEHKLSDHRTGLTEHKTTHKNFLYIIR